jgi:hypothetical protein
VRVVQVFAEQREAQIVLVFFLFGISAAVDANANADHGEKRKNRVQSQQHFAAVYSLTCLLGGGCAGSETKRREPLQMHLIN